MVRFAQFAVRRGALAQHVLTLHGRVCAQLQCLAVPVPNGKLKGVDCGILVANLAVQ